MVAIILMAFAAGNLLDDASELILITTAFFFRLRVGDAASFRADYVARLARHRDHVRALCLKHGWSLAIHRTDRPASQALLALRMRLENAGSAQAGAA